MLERNGHYTRHGAKHVLTVKKPKPQKKEETQKTSENTSMLEKQAGQQTKEGKNTKKIQNHHSMTLFKLFKARENR